MSNPARLPTDEEIRQVKERINHYYRTLAPEYFNASGFIMIEADITITRTDESVTIGITPLLQEAGYRFGRELNENTEVTYTTRSITFKLS